jgi:hypothetical protein
MSALGGMFSSGGASTTAETASAMSSGSAASSGALSGSLGSAYAAPAAATIGSAAPAMSTVAGPSMWSNIGSTIGQFGKDYAAGQANPYNTSGLGMNAQTIGQISSIGDQGDSAGQNALTSYLQRKQLEDQQRRGY